MRPARLLAQRLLRAPSAAAGPLPLEGRQQPVAVVLNSEGQPCDLRRTGPDFDWTAYFQELEARGVHTLVTDDDPAFRKALQGCGLDRQLCVVHMRRTVRRRLQRMRKDKILLTPEDAAVLQGVVSFNEVM